MNEEAYIAVLCVGSFIIGMYAREKLEVLLRRRRKVKPDVFEDGAIPEAS